MSIPPIVPIVPLSPLTSINSVASSGTEKPQTSDDGVKAGGTDFTKFLTDALKQVDALQKNADAASLGLASGQIQDFSTAMIALEKAGLSLSLTVAARDKVIDAYNQIMRMQM